MAEDEPDPVLGGYVAANHAYRTGDWSRLERHLEEGFDADCVLEDGTEDGVFTEAEWRGP